MRAELQRSVRESGAALAELEEGASPGMIGPVESPSVKRDRGGEEGGGSGREAKRGRKDPEIHPRNAYAAEEPNFANLAEKDERLRPYVTVDGGGRGRLDFTDANACRSSLLSSIYTHLIDTAIGYDTVLEYLKRVVHGWDVAQGC